MKAPTYAIVEERLGCPFSAAKNKLLGGQPNTLPGVPAEKPQEQNS